MARQGSARCYGVARQPEGSRPNSMGPPRYPSPHRARALMARPWSARCYGVARQPEGSRPNSMGPPALSLSSPREGADGQAVVCPLLRGSSPTRAVAPKQHGGSGVLSLRPFGLALSLGAWGVGAEENLARRSKYGFGRRDAARPARAAWAA